MKLSISNIAWEANDDEKVYRIISDKGYSGLEIAPTRIFPDNPYEKKEDALEWARKLKVEYGLEISSMQSIWYGRQEKIFGEETERKILIDYTKLAIDFAAIIGCKNIVFGCPRNRNISSDDDYFKGVSFFRELGEYAYNKGTVIGMEANPPIYNTNFINNTSDALKLINDVDSMGFKLNLDVGTMLENIEKVELLESNVKHINHVHVSEPGLKIIKRRSLHKELLNLLHKFNYSGYISIEMGKVDNIDALIETLSYISELVKIRE
ncbi:sugar phosphate isomerase/epimerase family protein [uncultured Clostridium sp.]|uniref:sugar phosphate isomerase/epimerase family protein n=1 Tax=uncultured Clostridium sp. TaxID=59620 RepID=UPI0025DFD59F|nr:sugar phosphate isomerase/epimerase family protein [uncultured Clostridium sp.]